MLIVCPPNYISELSERFKLCKIFITSILQGSQFFAKYMKM